MLFFCKTTKGCSGVLLGLLLAMTGCFALADDNAIEYRQAIYSSIGNHMKAMAAIVKGEVSHVQDLPTLATGLAELTRLLPHVFPRDSRVGDTDALPVIWQEAEEFQSRLDDLKEVSGELAIVARMQNIETFVKTLTRLGKVCKGCHDNFKAE